MPVVSEAQRGLMGADLARLRAGKKTRTGMTEEQLVEWLRKSRGKRLPARVHHSALAAAAHRRLAGVEMRDAGREIEKLPKVERKWYPSLVVQLDKVPELAGRKVGETFPIVAEVSISAIRLAEEEGKGKGLVELKVLSIGAEKVPC